MRVVALVVAATMTTSGCATYQGARQARNAGIVMGVVAVAAIAGGVALSTQSNAPPCENDGNDCVITGADVGAFFLILTGVGLIPYALAFTIVGQSGMNAHEPEVQRHEEKDLANYREAELRVEERNRVTLQHLQSATNDAAIAARAGNCELVFVHARYVYNLSEQYYANVFAQDPAIYACLPKVRDPKDREQAFALVKTASAAAKAGDCTTVVQLEGQIRALDESVHRVWFVSDASIKACLPPPAPSVQP